MTPRKVQKLVVFGKGGIGKSTVCANLAVVYARQGKKVLLVGCDPKHDTTIYLTRGKHIPTVLQSPQFQGGTPSRASLVFEGALGIDCVEAGGPEPGVGCAGRGITRMSELLRAAGVIDDTRYDVILYDVLGDVVCGGFATPLREGFAEKVAIVTSEELMALYAANNIARAIKNNAGHGNALVGIIANVRDPDADHALVERFAARIGTRVTQFIERDPLVREAEYQKMTVAEMAPDSAIVAVYHRLATLLAETPADPSRVPTPMSDEEFHELSRRKFEGGPAGEERARAPLAVAPEIAAPEPPPVAEPWRRFLLASHEGAGGRPPRWFEEESLNANAAATRLQTALAEEGFAAAPRRARSVNLLGLPEGRAAEECAALLEAIGIPVNARLVPRFDSREARRFLAAEQCVVHARPALARSLEHALEAVDLPQLRVPLPFGLRLSREWLLAVAAGTGVRDAAERAWAAWEASHLDAWEDGRRRARDLRVAFVVGPEDQAALTDGSSAAALPLASVVREMGFGVDVLLFAGGRAADEPGEAGVIHRFASPQELELALRDGAFHAVYSDYPLDPRISRNGKVQIGLPLFDAGPDGALRAQARLISACRRRVLAIA